MNLAKTSHPIDRFFNTSLSEFFNTDFTSQTPSVNIIEEEDAFVLELAAPGYTKKDFQLEVLKDKLIISAEIKENEDKSNEEFTRKEFSYASFKRSFHLPESTDHESIDASYKDGILNIKLGKLAEAKDKKKSIKIS